VEEAVEKIVVFDSYDTVIQANLVKTKLDAYGIPCFLSEENFTTWYPFRNQLFPGVRLHIFETDFAQVREIISEESALTIEETVCPHCHSKNVVVEETEANTGWQEALSTFLFITPRKKIFLCNTCRHEWV
jgi:hypothetical protein